MRNIIELLRKNWMVLGLLVVVTILLMDRRFGGVTQGTVFDSRMGAGESESGFAKSEIGMMPPSPIFESPPVDQQERLVVRTTNVSLKVNGVREAIDDIGREAVRLGGFMVDSSLNAPEGPATGQISVRIPAEKLTEGLATIRALGVKVVSENVMGTDVTSEFVDLTARLETLSKTKAKFDQILASATEINDILSVQREIMNLQAQIDAVRGQQKYLEQTAKLSLLTVYLATDELALPFTPDDAWRPGAIFKEATRSLIGSVRGVGAIFIWLVVYAIVGVPLLAGLVLSRRILRKLTVANRN